MLGGLDNSRLRQLTSGDVWPAGLELCVNMYSALAGGMQAADPTARLWQQPETIIHLLDLRAKPNLWLLGAGLKHLALCKWVDLGTALGGRFEICAADQLSPTHGYESFVDL